jgi:SAM-dependent methyltransferase
LPLGDESVTLAVSNYAFHHLADAEKEIALAEVRRVLVPGGRLVICDMMFSLSLDARDRKLVWSKLVAIARRGPSGLLRIARNAGRVAVGRWEHPAPPDVWARMLAERHFDDVSVELLENEAGLACARRPDRGPPPSFQAISSRPRGREMQTPGLRRRIAVPAQPAWSVRSRPASASRFSRGIPSWWP